MAYKSTILFDAINNILVSKSDETYKRHIADPNFKDCSAFMLFRYMTMSPDSSVREIALREQTSLEKMNAKTLYRHLMRVMPRQNSGFIRYLR